MLERTKGASGPEKIEEKKNIMINPELEKNSDTLTVLITSAVIVSSLFSNKTNDRQNYGQ